MQSTSLPLIVLALFLLFGGNSRGSASEPKFAGVLVSGPTVHVILIDSVSGRSSGWIQIGGKFEEYTVKGYDASSERLIVSAGQVERSLPLIGGSKIVSSISKFKIGSRDFQIFADAVERDGDRTVYRGRVTGISVGSHFSCDELTVNAGREEMFLVGAVKLQQGTALVQAKHLRIGR